MERRSVSERLATRLSTSHSGGVLYGAVVTAAVLVTVGGHGSTAREVVLAWLIVLVTYWLTHVYVVTWQGQFEGDTRPLLVRLVTGAGHEVTVLLGGVPAMLVFLVASMVGMDAFDAERLALYSTVVLLAVLGYVGARFTGRSRGHAWLEALGAALLGLVLVAAKSLLH